MIVDGYVRVSQVRGRSGDSFMSPQLQREQIERWAAAQGHHVAMVHVELDESGGRPDRPMLIAMMERVEAGVIDGVAVAKLDRFGRSLIDGLANIERIRRAGGAFVSVQDGLDLSTDTGKLVLRIMLSMAEWELDRIRSTWDNARRRAIERGMHLGSVAPFGYVHGPNRRLRLDPERVPQLVELFKRRGDGATIAALQHFLEAEGVPTAHGGTVWRYNSISALLGNRVYLGELRSGRHLKIAAHEPLIDEATWQAAQTPRVIGPRYVSAEPTLVIGLVRCASCGLAMQGIWRANRSATYRDYRCPGISSGGRCPSRARARGWELEHLIEEAFFTLARQRPRTRAATNPNLLAKLTGAQADLAAYRDHPGLLPRLGATRFEAASKHGSTESSTPRWPLRPTARASAHAKASDAPPKAGSADGPPSRSTSAGTQSHSSSTAPSSVADPARCPNGSGSALGAPHLNRCPAADTAPSVSSPSIPPSNEP